LGQGWLVLVVLKSSQEKIETFYSLAKILADVLFALLMATQIMELFIFEVITAIFSRLYA